MFDDTGFFFELVIHRFRACCFGDSYSGHKLESGLSWLVGGWEHVFPYIGNFIIPTDKLIFFRGVGIPPTSENVRFRETTKLGTSSMKGMSPTLDQLETESTNMAMDQYL